MNREFRGKTKQGEWVEGFYVCNRYSVGFAKEPAIYENHYIYTKRIDGEKWFKTIQVEVIPETVGQFTGLTDKNGKKIFEGDIVKDLGGSMDGIPRVVFWNEEWMEFECHLVKKHWAYGINCCRLWCIKDRELEVIGNKWENPELLGE